MFLAMLGSGKSKRSYKGSGTGFFKRSFRRARHRNAQGKFLESFSKGRRSQTSYLGF